MIDESLILFEGRLGFKQYIPSKRHRFGLKSSCCVTVSVVILDMIVCTGVDTAIVRDDPHGKSGAVVK